MKSLLAGGSHWTIATIFLLLTVCSVLPSMSLSSVSPAKKPVTTTTTTSPPPPIVYTIAGSDSGGGAGIQADLHAIANFGCHGCSAITCLTAQNSVGVTAVHTPPVDFLTQQLDALQTDLPPAAIKIGMLATKELAVTVGAFLKQLKESSSSSDQRRKVWVVLDPVMISTSGSRLLDQEAQQTLIDQVFPYVDVITPNKFEAEALLGGRTLTTVSDVEQAARDLLKLGNNGVPAVLIKGGHTDENSVYAQDYLLLSSSSTTKSDNEPRLCDGDRGGVWMQSPRYDTVHTHGTGCTLSSAMAAALALGQRSCNGGGGGGGGAYHAMDLVDACCLAKAYVTAGIYHGVPLGKGPGPVAQTVFPDSYRYYPCIIISPKQNLLPAFLPMKAFSSESTTTVDDRRPTLGRILPIVDSIEWVERLCKNGDVQDIQLRIKGENDKDRILQIVKDCQTLCQAANVRLWINDYWEVAVQAGCFGVHVGQEDLVKCIQAGGLESLQKHGMALGISTHTFGELAAALGVKPSYISLGPVFATGSKNVQFEPQGLDIVAKWRQLVPPDMPLVAIGGIGDADAAAQVRAAGADCVAVIGAVTTGSTKAEDIAAAVSKLNEAMI